MTEREVESRDVLREKHREKNAPPTMGDHYCVSCGRNWPCDVIKALDIADQARAEADEWRNKAVMSALRETEARAEGRAEALAEVERQCTNCGTTLARCYDVSNPWATPRLVKCCPDCDHRAIATVREMGQS